MSKFHSIARKFFVVGLVFLAVAFILGFGRVAALSIGAVSSKNSAFEILGVVGTISIFVFLACAAVLWIEGVIVTFKQWKQKSVWISIGRLAFLITGHFFAAYVLHALLRYQSYRLSLKFPQE